VEMVGVVAVAATPPRRWRWRSGRARWRPTAEATTEEESAAEGKAEEMVEMAVTGVGE